MYSKISKERYCNIPYYDTTANTPCEPYYVYTNIEELAKHEVTEKELENVVCSRNIGILWSEHAKFYISDISSTGGVVSNVKIQVSLKYYMKSGAFAAVTPCPVQMFGTIHWHAKRPVIYVKIIQVLSIPQALRLRDAMNNLPLYKPQDRNSPSQ